MLSVRLYMRYMWYLWIPYISVAYGKHHMRVISHIICIELFMYVCFFRAAIYYLCTCETVRQVLLLTEQGSTRRSPPAPLPPSPLRPPASLFRLFSYSPSSIIISPPASRTQIHHTYLYAAIDIILATKKEPRVETIPLLHMMAFEVIPRLVTPYRGYTSGPESQYLKHTHKKT